MADYQYVQTQFWNDSFVLDLTPEEKGFYLYLMTCPLGNITGAFELPLRVIEMHTGYNRETVEKLLKRFTEYGKVAYDWTTKEVLLVNWLRHNGNTSPKLTAKYTQQVCAVKSATIKAQLIGLIAEAGITLAIKSDTPSIPYPYPSDTTDTDTTQTQHNTTQHYSVESEVDNSNSVGVENQKPLPPDLDPVIAIAKLAQSYGHTGITPTQLRASNAAEAVAMPLADWEAVFERVRLNKPNERVPLGYLLPILADMRKSPEGFRPVGRDAQRAIAAASFFKPEHIAHLTGERHERAIN